MSLAANLAVAAGILVSGLAALLMTIGLISYFRMKSGRFLWVAVAFALFAVQGILLTVRMYQERGDLPEALPGLTFLNLGIVAALYLAVLRQ